MARALTEEDTKARRRLSRLRGTVLKHYQQHGRSYPWRYSDSPYLRLVAEIMLQRTRAEAVAKVWPVFAARFPSPESLHESAVPEIIEVVKSLGLANKRVRSLRELARRLVEAGAEDDRAQPFLAGTGIGPYTRNAWLATWMRQRTPAVDANVRRVFQRLLGFDRLSLSELVPLAEWFMSRGDPVNLLFGLIDFGADPCGPKRPSCAVCPAKAYCSFAHRADFLLMGPSAVDT